MPRQVKALLAELRDTLAALPPAVCDPGMLNEALRSLADCQTEVEAGHRLAAESVVAESVLKSLTPEQIAALKRRFTRG